MRAWWIVLLLPTATALPSLSILDPLVLPDPSGDVRGEPVDAGGQGYIDIVEAIVDLDETRLRLQVKVADVTLLNNAESQRNDKPVWAVFTAMGERFLLAVLIEPRPLIVDGQPVLDEQARLYRFDNDRWALIETYPPDHDYEQGVFAVDVPLQTIRGRDGFPLAPGNVVTLLELHARDADAEVIYDPNSDPATSGGLGQALRIYRDDVDVPADAFLAVPKTLTGVVQAVTELPLRYSNGGGSFHWPVRVHNPTDAAVVVVVHGDAHEGVKLHYPTAFSLAPRGTADIDVLAVLPFAHQHGGLVDIAITFTAGGQDTVLPLGVQYLTIPQPAGHHDTVWLHAPPGESLRGTGTSTPNSAYINTLEDDPAGNAARLAPGSATCDFQTGQPGQDWYMPLRPGLLIGLDARIDETARFQATFSSGDLPVGPHDLHIGLIVLDRFAEPQDAMRGLITRDDVFHGDLSVPLGQKTDLVVDIPIPSRMNRIDPSADMPNLALGVLLCAQQPSTGGERAFIERGGHLQLPLEEYQVVIRLPGDTSLTVDEPVVRAAPGATILWQPAFAGSGTYRASVFGPHADLATVDERPFTTAAPRLVMRVPEAAVKDDLLQVIYIVTNIDEPLDTAVVVLAIQVDPTATRDDAHLLTGGSGKDSPAAGAMALMLLLAVGAALRGGRHRSDR